MNKQRWTRIIGLMLVAASVTIHADGYRFPIPSIVLGIGAYLATHEAR
jgi:hypothetical protein